MSVSDVNPAEAVLRVSQSLFAVFIAILVASVVVTPAESLARAFGFATESAGFATIQTIGQFLGFLFASVAFLYYADDRDLVSVRKPTVRDAGLIVGGLCTLLVVQFGLIYGVTLLGFETAENQAITTGQQTPLYFLYMIPVSILLVGPAEELLFRGIVQGEVKRALGAPAGIAFASLLFGLIHYSAVGGTLEQRVLYIGIAALLGALLGVLYEYTGNITVPALAHGSYNAVLFVLQYADTAGL
jgi:hypothetical protein